MASESAIVQVTLDDLFVREAENVIMKDGSEKPRHLGPAEEHQGKSRLRFFPQRKQLYEQGLSDSAIARELGVTTSNILVWRKRRNLPPNFPPNLSPESSARRQQLYEQGFSDCEIARKLGVTQNAISKWMRRRNLPSNLKNSFPRRQELYEQSLSDAAIAREVGVSRASITDWRKRRNLPRSLRPGRRLRSLPRRQELYEQGLGDCAIARAEGVTHESIWRWRKRRNLPPNKQPLRFFPQRQELYDQRLCDSEIARAEGVFPSNIREWRMRRNLHRNLPSSFLRRQELYDKGLTDREIAEELGLRPNAIRSWRNQHKLPSNFFYRIKSDLINEYLKDVKVRFPSTGTVHVHRHNLGLLERFLNGKKPEEATLKDIRDFLNNLKEKRRTRGTIAHHLSAIKSFYEYVNRYHGINVPDLRWLRAKEYKHREEWEGAGRGSLSRDEVRRLINAPDTLRDTLLIGMLYYSGLRAGEAAGLKIEKVDTKRREMEVVGKGNKPRTVPYHPRLDWLIDKWLNKVRRSYVNSGNSDYFFVSKSGAKLTVNRIERVVYEAAEKAGIQKVVAKKSDGTKIYKVKPHVLRHTFATHLDEDFANASEIRIVPRGYIQEIMGHEKMITTMGYIHSDARFKSYYKYFKGI